LDKTYIIDGVLDGFPFGETSKFMKAIGWTWAGIEDNAGVPDECLLRSHARGLLEKAVAESYGQPVSISSGGFNAKITERGCSRLSLEFVPHSTAYGIHGEGVLFEGSGSFGGRDYNGRN
jgi:hypothetical protein